MPTISRTDYENLLYSLEQQFSEISVSTLRLYPNGRTTAYVRGSVQFKNGIELRIFEYLDFSDGKILEYSYTVLRDNEKILWYDPQPHPEVESLKSTFPHHLHEPPNIKQNRQPAPGISFDAPNLPKLIQDCIELGESLSKQTD